MLEELVPSMEPSSRREESAAAACLSGCIGARTRKTLDVRSVDKISGETPVPVNMDEERD